MQPDTESDQSTAGPERSAIYFDGSSSRRQEVTLAFKGELEIADRDRTLAIWSYADIRRADSPLGILRVTCSTAPELARLEIRQGADAIQLAAHCRYLDEAVEGQRGVWGIIGWSLAAVFSIVVLVWFGIPLAADRLARLIPQSFERRVGDIADEQMKTLYSANACENAPGQAAFAKLMKPIREAAGLDVLVGSSVLSSKIPNAFALPGGKVFLFNGLLAKAEDPDEIAGVLAHELGHLKHHDNMRGMIEAGGTSFLIGLLFGDITGSSVLILASRSIVNAAHSREAEADADAFSIDVMHRLGRSSSKMGELLLRVTGNEAGNSIAFLASHPLTEDRLARMRKRERPPSAPPLLTPEEWLSLKSICDSGSTR